MARRTWRWLPLFCFAGAAACMADVDDVRVRVVPAQAAVPIGATFQFSSRVDGTFAGDVTWRVVPGSCGAPDCGSMTGSQFTAPLSVPPALVTIEAASDVSEETGTAEVQVVPFELDPATGVTAGGTRVTIRAAGFGSTAQVFFDGVPGTDVVVLSPGELEVDAPPHAVPGPVPVRVETSGRVLDYPGVFRYAATNLRAGGSQLRRSCLSAAPPVLAEMTGDAHADVLVACSALRQVAVFPGDGAGGVGPLGYVPADLLSADSFFAEDWENDGDADVFLANGGDAVVLTVQAGAVVESKAYNFPVGTGTPTATPSSTASPGVTPTAPVFARLSAIGNVCGGATNGMVIARPDESATHVVCRAANAASWTHSNTLDTTGLLPADAVAADFDGDGVDEIGVALPSATPGDTAAGGYQVYKRSGSVFTTTGPVQAAPGFFLEAITAGELTGDSEIDLVLGGVEPPSLFLLPGGAGLTFGAAIAIPVPGIPEGFRPGSLEVADVDGDGHLDVVGRAQVSGAPQIAVFYGDGATLASPVIIPSVPSPAGALGRFADLESDGGPLTAISRIQQSSTTGTAYLQLLASDASRNVGPMRITTETRVSSLASIAGSLYGGRRETASEDAGLARLTLGPPAATDVAALPAGVDVSRLAVTRVDADTFDDLLIADDGALDASGGIWLAAGAASFAFAAPVPMVTGYQILDAAAGDLDGDGRIDLAAAELAGADELVVWFGSGGTPAFVGPSFVSNVTPTRVAIGDVGSDGLLELVTTDSLSSSVFTFGFDAARTPILESALPLGGTVPTDFLLADLDGDTLLDLAVRSRFATTLINIDIFSGTLDGFDPQPRQRIRLDETTSPAIGMTAGDVDGDGLLDLVVPVGTPSSFAILRGRADGSLESAPELIPYPGVFSTLGLLNANGVPPDDFLACDSTAGADGLCFGFVNESL